MTDLPDSSAPPPDPEVEALLDFPPVVRKCVRQNGWTAERQREFIRALVVLGSAEQAAIAVEGTMSGVYKLRTAAGGKPFAASWDSALALHFRRNPKPEPKGRPSRGEIESGVGRKPWPRPAPPPPDPEAERDMDAEWEAFSEGMLVTYLTKLAAEREARLDGRIIEADFIVRQLTWLEVALDLTGVAPRAAEFLKGLKRGDLEAREISATPMSALLARLRRIYWKRCGEPERPSPAPLGRHDDEAATGEPLECQHSPDRDGPIGGGSERAEHLRRNAEAQRAWEERAREDSEAWASREAGRSAKEPEDPSGPGPEGEARP
jgi:hypothetical protein